MRLYFDHAASAPMLPEVIEEMHNAFHKYHGNPSSIHVHGRQARTALEDARKRVAHHLNASVGEIFFTSGGTEANNLALKSTIQDLEISAVLTTRIEHPCVLKSIDHILETTKVKRVYLDVDAKGRLDPKHLSDQLSTLEGQKCLVSVMHANNEIGTINNLRSIGEVCRNFNAIFHSDTVQTVGHFRLNLSDLPIDMAAGSAHKFHGPKGTGFLYLNSNLSLKPLIDGGGQERNMRAGTENVAGVLGMAKSLDLCHSNMDQMTEQTGAIRNYAMEHLQSTFPEIKINGDPLGDSLYTVLSVTFPMSPLTDLLIFNLDIEGISASGGSACSSGVQKTSHVLQTLMPEDTGTTVRFSFAHTNTFEEVDFLLEKLIKILRK